MNSTESSKFQSSQLIEDFLQPSEQSHKNWLLTYLDVFVLIIMLFITLIAFSDLKTQQNKKATAQLANNSLQSKVDDIPVQQEVTATAALTRSSSDDNTPPITTSNNIDKSTQQTPQELAQDLTSATQEPYHHANESAEITTENQQTQTQPPSTNDEISLEEQLDKKVEELGLTDSVNLKVSLGYAQLEIQDNILFHSSDAKLVKAGESVLKKLVTLLQQSSGLIYIEGHTDNRPIKTLKYPSNWELGAARATSVLHYLASQKLDANRLRAITYADTKPIADNNTEEGRGKNRRVNLVIKVSDKID